VTRCTQSALECWVDVLGDGRGLPEEEVLRPTVLCYHAKIRRTNSYLLQCTHSPQAVMVERKKLDIKDLGFTKSGVPTGLSI
jgi:hypothetical protein